MSQVYLEIQNAACLVFECCGQVTSGCQLTPYTLDPSMQTPPPAYAIRVTCNLTPTSALPTPLPTSAQPTSLPWPRPPSHQE